MVHVDERTKKWHRRLEEIVDAAAGLFAERGYAATGVSDLCDAVGLGKGALYYYIDSKENLLNLIHDRVMDDLLTTAEQVERLDAGPAEQLRLLGIEMVRIVANYPDHVWVFMHEYRSLTGERASTFRQKRRRYEKVLRNVLERGRDEGVFDLPDDDLTELAWLGMHNYTYIWYRSDGQHTPLEISSVFHTIFMRGILSADHG